MVSTAATIGNDCRLLAPRPPILSTVPVSLNRSRQHIISRCPSRLSLQTSHTTPIAVR